MAVLWNDLKRTSPPLSEHVKVKHFTGAGTADITCPTGYGFVVFSVTGSGNLWVRRGAGAAAVPSGDVGLVDGTGSFPNPAGALVGEGEVFSIAVDAACDVAMAFYKFKVI